jgi:cobalt-zinc-cadmium resistance protein CzcA
VQYGPQVISGQGGFYQFQAGLSIPLIFPEQLGETQAQKIRVQQALEMEKERSLEFNLAATRAQQNYTKWRQAWQYYENEALALAKEQRQGALFAFKEGAIDYLSFIQNTQNAMQLELAAWQTFEAYLNAHYQLQYFLAP